MDNRDSAFRRVVEHQFTAVAVLDSEFRVEHINSSAELLLVRSEKQLIGHRFDSLFVEPEDIRAVLKSAIEEGASVSVRSTTWHLNHHESLTLDFIVSPFMEGEDIRVILEMVPADRAVRISRDEGRIDQSDARL